MVLGGNSDYRMSVAFKLIWFLFESQSNCKIMDVGKCCFKFVCLTLSLESFIATVFDVTSVPPQLNPSGIQEPLLLSGWDFILVLAGLLCTHHLLKARIEDQAESWETKENKVMQLNIKKKKWKHLCNTNIFSTQQFRERSLQYKHGHLMMVYIHVF